MSHSDDVKIGLPTVWAIGVGSVLGGDFFGWQFVTYGGVLPAFASVAIASAFYWLYAGVITELAARYRTTGGSFDFVRRALGDQAATAMAILQLLKLIIANAALALAISSYMIQGGMSRSLQLPCWALTYGTFTLLDSVGVRQSASVQVLATVLCIAILGVYVASAFTQFDVDNLIRPGDLSRDGLQGFFKGLPFALQFFDGFEETPLLMEYTQDPTVTIPKGIAASYFSITLIAIFMIIAGCGVTPIDQLLRSEAPLMPGIDTVYGVGQFSDVVALLVVVGLLVNFFAFVLFSSQQIQAIAEAGHLPSVLAYRHSVHGAPILASIAASLLGLVLCASFSALFDEAQAQNTLVTAALMPAVLGYVVVLECVARIRCIEEKQASGAERISSAEIFVLGHEPDLVLRFPYGAAVVRMTQSIAALFVVGLLVLASVQVDFTYGLAVILILGLLMFALMNYWAGKSAGLRSIVDGVGRVSGLDDSMPSNRSNYMVASDADDDGDVVVSMNNPVHGGVYTASPGSGPTVRKNPGVARGVAPVSGNSYLELRRHNEENNDAIL